MFAASDLEYSLKDDTVSCKMQHLAWNVDPAIFVLGPIEIRWYGLFFALAFFSASKSWRRFTAGNSESSKICPSLSVYDARYNHRREARSRLALSA
jgi:hypothetical protein